MQFIDMHCDSLMQLLTLNQKEADLKDSAVTSVDFTRMKAGGQLAQFFAVFLPPQEGFRMLNITPLPDEEYIKTLASLCCPGRCARCWRRGCRRRWRTRRRR